MRPMTGGCPERSGLVRNEVVHEAIANPEGEEHSEAVSRLKGV
jgi:hypothetical protein